jgi:uncharacterized membrane-anchored protein YhcB (DUF1043 family)
VGNLGAYQLITTVAKKVGGPVKLAAGVAVGGYVVIRTAEGVIKKVIKKVKKHKETKTALNTSKLYTVHECAESNEGLMFNISDTYRVLEKDGDSVLIEKIGDANNPYFVSEELLGKISDYED